MRHYFLFILLCLFGKNVFAQFKISGQVLDEKNNPLSGCHIHLSNKIAVSDPLGKYVIMGKSNYKNRFLVTFLGYKTIDTLVILNQNLVLNLKMKPVSNNLNEVVLLQKHNSQNVSAFEHKINSESIEKYSNQSLADALKEITGVSILKTGSNIVKPIINGLHSSRVPIISNNVRLEDQQWGTEHAPNFDINSAGKITVIKGASSFQFGGDAVGGMVIVEPIAIKKDTLFGKTIVSLVTNGKGGTISSSLHKGNFCDWSWNAIGTFKYSGDKQSAGYILSNSGDRATHFSADLKYTGQQYETTVFYSYYNAQIGILSASHIGNVNDLYQSIQNQIPFIVNDFTYSLQNPRQEVQHHLAKFNYNRKINSSTTTDFQYSFQHNHRLEFDIRRGGLSTVAALDLKLITNTFNLDWKTKLENWVFKYGNNFVYQNNFANPATGVQPLIPYYDKKDIGIYGVAEHIVSETLQLDAGLRYDFSDFEATKYYLKTRWSERGYETLFSNFIIGEQNNQWLTKPKFQFDNLSASLGFRKEFKNSIYWYTNLSLTTRNPNPAELFSDGLHHSTGIIELGNLNLNKEQSIKITTTLLKKWSAFSIEAMPFINSIQNFMFLKPVGLETTIRGAFPVWEYQQSQIRMFGIDMQTQWNFANNWSHTLALAYVNGKNISENKPLIEMPPFNFSNQIQFEQQRWNGLKISLKNEIVLQQNQFPDYNFMSNIFKNDVLEPVLVNISSPPSAYQLWSFYAEAKLSFFKKSSTTIAFTAQNILNTKYRDYLNKQRFFADELGRNLQLQIKINY